MFSVDNASVAGVMDFSSLPANLWMIHWIDGKGEIEYQTAAGDNLNGLREEFFDVIPYASFFQQFLSHLPDLTLAQAKKVQVDLIATIYGTKRQAPYSYLSHMWDATDGVTAAMALQMLPKLFNSIGFVDTFTNDLTNQLNADLNVLNYQILTTNANSLSVTLQRRAISVPTDPFNPTNFDCASPGLSGNLPLMSFISYPVGYALSATVPWTPLDQATPINLTMGQMSSLMTGIAGRQQNLNGVRTSKTNAVNAMTKITDVIAYNVTTGWP
jgi:hypothetical protein